MVPLSKERVLVCVLLGDNGNRLLRVQGKQPLPDCSGLVKSAKLNQGHYEGSQPSQECRHGLAGLVSPRQRFLRATSGQQCTAKSHCGITSPGIKGT